MIHVPMCLWCDEHEVKIVTDGDGAGFCSKACQSEAYRWPEYFDVDPVYADSGQWDNDPNPYEGTYSEE